MAHRSKNSSTFDTSQYDEDDGAFHVNNSREEDSDESGSDVEIEDRPRSMASQGSREKKQKEHDSNDEICDGRQGEEQLLIVSRVSSGAMKKKRKLDESGKSTGGTTTLKKKKRTAMAGVSVGEITTPRAEGDLSVLTNVSVLESENNGLRRQCSGLVEQIERLKTYVQRGSGNGKSVARLLKKKDFVQSDLLNIKAVNKFVTGVIWPKVKMMPKNWHMWSTDPRSTCARMLSKVSVPVGMEPKMYWKEMLCVFANDKLCASRANFKMSLLQRYKGMFYY